MPWMPSCMILCSTVHGRGGLEQVEPSFEDTRLLQEIQQYCLAHATMVSAAH